MKKVKLFISRCINKKCGFYIITENKKHTCPLCKNPMKKDNKFKIQGYINEEKMEETFIGLKKRAKNGNNNR